MCSADSGFRLDKAVTRPEISDRTPNVTKPSRRRGSRPVGVRSRVVDRSEMREEPDAEDVQLDERQHRIAQRRVVDDSGNVDGEIRGVRADLLAHERAHTMTALTRIETRSPSRTMVPGSTRASSRSDGGNRYSGLSSKIAQ
jgi:hypothetical protein